MEVSMNRQDKLRSAAEVLQEIAEKAAPETAESLLDAQASLYAQDEVFLQSMSDMMRPAPGQSAA
jgi:hypothetical protein